MIKKSTIFILSLVLIQILTGQTILKFKDTTLVKLGETMVMNAGTICEFDSNAIIIIEGSLIMNGTETNPIIVKNRFNDKPGKGILISGHSELSKIGIKNTQFDGLIQPLKFEKYWYRNSVSLIGIDFKNSNSNLPLLHIESPIIYFSKEKVIQINFEKCKFNNNTTGVIIDDFGSYGINFHLNEISFNNNINPLNDDPSYGFLHFNFANIFDNEKVKIGLLSFDKNYSGKLPSGISVKGKSFLSVSVDRLAHSNSDENIVFDHNKNKSLPSIVIKEMNGAPINNSNSVVVSGNIVTNKSGIDESGNLYLNFRWPLFKKKGEIITKIQDWEYGIWGGGAIYGGGDLALKTLKDFRTAPSFLKNTIILKDLPLFSTIEYSFGLYGQYNLNSRFSVKGTLYLSTISVHNEFAPALLGSGKLDYSFDANYNSIPTGSSTFENRFITRMQILEIEGLWHLRTYKMERNDKYKFIPSLGLSLGVLHFTPYRIANADRKTGESSSDYESRLYSDHMYSLRDLGSEGQNFLPGKSPYSPLAFNLGTSFSLTYLKKRYTLKGEMKVAYTSTDYLDDYGPGIWYGGDYDKMVSSAYKMYDNIPQADMNAITWTPNSNKQKRVGWINPRSTDGLNDWYYQLHLGMSYFIFK
jgi:hypothetical protein